MFERQIKPEWAMRGESSKALLERVKEMQGGVNAEILEKGYDRFADLKGGLQKILETREA
ncbi:MAG: hypothetical protein ABI430_01340 [Candidatus Taylorbacteria bacterium]